jgi:homocysteine S-methyltransferase
VGVDPNSVNLENEIHRFGLKKEAGAEFVITQPVFDVESLEEFMKRADLKGLYLIAGIWPLVSLRNAEFMKNEVPGVYVPDEVITRMARYESREDQLKAGIEIAQQMVDRVITSVQGIQVSAPFGKYDLALQVAGRLLDQDK